MSGQPDGIVCSCCTRAALEGGAPPCAPLPVLEDRVVGLCAACGRILDGAEDWGRGRMQLTTFIDARIPLMADRLIGDGRRKFLELPYRLQAQVVIESVLDGLLP